MMMWLILIARLCTRKMQSQPKKSAKTLALFGALVMIGKIGIRTFRSLMEEQAGSRSWKRMKKKIDSLRFSNNEKFIVLANIGKAIEAFQPLKLREFDV
jgi:hypothetical protein